MQAVGTLLRCPAPCRTIPKHTYKPDVRSKNTLQFTPMRNALLTLYMYCNILYHNTLALEIAHVFKKIYSDDILNLKEQFTPDELTAAITVELIERKIQRIVRKHT